jgi:ankyrin repeat protein
MMFACKYLKNIYFETFSLLLSFQNIDLNIATEMKETCLMFTCSNGKYEESEKVLRLLLTNKNIDLNLHDKKGRTSLMYACMNSKNHFTINFIKVLMSDERLDINRNNPHDSKNCLTLICENSKKIINFDFILKLFLEHKRIEISEDFFDNHQHVDKMIIKEYFESRTKEKGIKSVNRKATVLYSYHTSGENEISIFGNYFNINKKKMKKLSFWILKIRIMRNGIWQKIQKIILVIFQ